MSASCIKDPSERTSDNDDGPTTANKTDGQSWLNMMTAMLNFAMTSTNLMMNIQSRVGVCGICKDENRELTATLEKIRKQFSASQFEAPKKQSEQAESCDPIQCKEAYETLEAGVPCAKKPSQGYDKSPGPNETSAEKLIDDDDELGCTCKSTDDITAPNVVVEAENDALDPFEAMRQKLDLPCYCKDTRECAITDEETPCLIDGKPPQPQISPACSTVESLKGATIPETDTCGCNADKKEPSQVQLKESDSCSCKSAESCAPLEEAATPGPPASIPSRQQSTGGTKIDLRGPAVCACVTGGTNGDPSRPPGGAQAQIIPCGNVAVGDPDVIVTIGIKTANGACCCQLMKSGARSETKVLADKPETVQPVKETGVPSTCCCKTDDEEQTENSKYAGPPLARPVRIGSVDSYSRRKSSNISCPPENCVTASAPEGLKAPCPDKKEQKPPEPNKEESAAEDCICDGNEDVTEISDNNCQTDPCEELSKQLQMIQLQYHLKQTDETLKELKKEVERISEFIANRKKPNEAAAALYREIMKPRTSIEEVTNTPMCCRRPTKRRN